MRPWCRAPCPPPASPSESQRRGAPDLHRVFSHQHHARIRGRGAIAICDERLRFTTSSLAQRGCAVCLITNRDDLNGTQSFNATTPITVVYDANTCLSSSCSRNAEAAVSAAAEGDTIAIGGCTDDCGFLGAESELGALAEGSYTVTFGEQSLTLTIPGEQVVCFGELWY